MMWNNPWVGIVRFDELPDYEPWDVVTRPVKPKRTRKRRMTLARAMRQAGEAGVAVKGATINGDGSVTLVFGHATSKHRVETDNEWDEVLQ